VLSAICLTYRYPSGVPGRNVGATTVAHACNEIFSNPSFPLHIISDQGAQFTSELCSQILDIWGIKNSKTTPYNPQFNDAVERLNALWQAHLLVLLTFLHPPLFP